MGQARGGDRTCLPKEIFFGVLFQIEFFARKLELIFVALVLNVSTSAMNWLTSYYLLYLNVFYSHRRRYTDDISRRHAQITFSSKESRRVKLSLRSCANGDPFCISRQPCFDDVICHR